MWNKYIKKGNTVDNVANKAVDFILTETSHKDATPPDNTIQLWPHQEAMLHRLRHIEKTKYLCKIEPTEASFARYMDKKEVPKGYDVCLGVMNDPPGSGKTYAILTHIRTDVALGTTIIIVPQNIYGQWRKSIETIFQNDRDACNFSTSYADIMNLYTNPRNIRRYKIILLLDAFAEAYMKVLNDNKISVRRIVVDEIDIMDKYVCSSVNVEFVWLMSASYSNQKRLGPYFIGDHTQVICKCDTAFVQKSLNLLPPTTKTIVCDDDHIQLFRDILDDNQMSALNAGDHNIINRIMNKSGAITPHIYGDASKKYAEYLLKKADQLPELEEEMKNFIITDGDSEREYNLLKDQVAQLRDFLHKSQRLEKLSQSLTDTFLPNCKESYLEQDFINDMKSDITSKWLIFNDNGNVLVKYQDILLRHGIKAVMLDGGNHTLIDRTLRNYKEGDVQVLLLNSMIEGAGMNLENTTHLLFMHKTEEKFIEQVMGRAQRYGRKGSLNIIILANKHE